MPLPDALYHPLTRRIAEHAGMRIGERNRWLLEARIEAARGELPADLFVARILEGDDARLGRLVELLRVGETRFWRHPRQLRALRRVALPELIADCEREGRPLRVWSAGCASGEEPYTIAALLRHVAPDLPLEIRATDLSPEALERARRASYAEERVRDVPDAIARTLFRKVGARFEVQPAIRELVRFEVGNLLQDPYPEAQDLVLCRNVLIYFDAVTRAQVLERLFASTRMHGYVALGYADRIGRTKGVESIRTEEGTLYRRVESRPSVLPAPSHPVDSVDSVDPVEPKRQPGPPPRSARKRRTSGTIESKPNALWRFRLVGELSGEAGRATAHAVAGRMLAAGSRRLDLIELRFADEGVAQELRRVAEALMADGRTLELRVASASMRRFLERHRVAPPAHVRAIEVAT